MATLLCLLGAWGILYLATSSSNSKRKNKNLFENNEQYPNTDGLIPMNYDPINVNPSTGMQMLTESVDVGGNAYGSSNEV